MGNDTSYLWTIPPTPSNRCRVRIRAFDRNNNIGDDISDANFTIYDPEAPAVQILAPNGGEVWYWNEVHQIQWNSIDNIGVDSINVYLSIDSGLTYPYRIVHFSTNDSLYNWVIPQLNSNKCLIKVIAYDLSANAGFDTSDSCFTIGAVGISEGKIALPVNFSINLLSSNPCNSEPIIQVAIPVQTNLEIKIYDITGKHINTIINQIVTPGYHYFILKKEKLSSGIYFISARTSESSAVKKITIFK
jgi:hypothetical protein